MEGPEMGACVAGSNSCQEPQVGQRRGGQKEQVREVTGSDTQGFRAVLRTFYSESCGRSSEASEQRRDRF